MSFSSSKDHEAFLDDIQSTATARALGQGSVCLPTSTKSFMQKQMQNLQRGTKVVTNDGQLVDAKYFGRKKDALGKRAHNNNLLNANEIPFHRKAISNANSHIDPTKCSNVTPCMDANENRRNNDPPSFLSSKNLSSSFKNEAKEAVRSSSESDDCTIIEKPKDVDETSKAKSMAKRVLVRLQTKYTNAIVDGSSKNKRPSEETIASIKKMKTNVDRFVTEVSSGNDVKTIKRLTKGGTGLDKILSQDVQERMEFEYEIMDL